MPLLPRVCVLFFFNDTATTEIYTLSLHDALPIYVDRVVALRRRIGESFQGFRRLGHGIGGGAPGKKKRRAYILIPLNQSFPILIFGFKKKKNHLIDILLQLGSNLLTITNRRSCKS